MKYIYVEVNNKTSEITCFFPYIVKGKSHIDVMHTLKDDTYTGYIVDVKKYTKEYQYNKRPGGMPITVHKFIISQNRSSKIKQIKNRMNV